MSHFSSDLFFYISLILMICFGQLSRYFCSLLPNNARLTVSDGKKRGTTESTEHTGSHVSPSAITSASWVSPESFHLSQHPLWEARQWPPQRYQHSNSQSVNMLCYMARGDEDEIKVANQLNYPGISQGPLNREEGDRRFQTRDVILWQRVDEPLLALKMGKGSMRQGLCKSLKARKGRETEMLTVLLTPLW